MARRAGRIASTFALSLLPIRSLARHHPAVHPDVAAQLASRLPRGKPVILACMPKSGSTLAATMLARALGYRQFPLVPGFSHREQEIDLLLASAARRRGVVSQMHVRYSPTSRQMASMLDAVTVVQTRNIFDVVMSLHTHVLKAPQLPMAWVPDQFRALDTDAQHRFIVDFMLPWYFNFYASWCEADAAGQVRAWLRYEDLARDPVVAIGHLIERLGLQVQPTSLGEILNAVGASATRKEHGVVGRGAQLSDEVRARVTALADSYRHLDLTPIGV